jgi:hypothetical protein
MRLSAIAAIALSTNERMGNRAFQTGNLAKLDIRRLDSRNYDYPTKRGQKTQIRKIIDNTCQLALDKLAVKFEGLI